MLCLSLTTGYAIKALACLNDRPGECLFIADVARCTGVPKPYLAKIVNSLSRQGLLWAKRGYKGGIALARPPAEITLLQIVEAVEGPEWLGPCLLALDDCGEDHACPTHEFWTDIRERIQQKLRETTLAEIIAGRQRARRRLRRGRRPERSAGPSRSTRGEATGDPTRRGRGHGTSRRPTAGIAS